VCLLAGYAYLLANHPVPMPMRMSFSVNRSDKLPEIRNL
jgi:hypothetical protein